MKKSILFSLFAALLHAQTSTSHQGHDMSKMNHDMSDMNHEMPGMGHDMSNLNAAGQYLMTMSSGTSMNPKSWPMPMLMPRLGSWSMMLMGQAFVVDTQQSGPRGGDKLFAPNWAMVSAVHSLGKGAFMLQTMWSLDPATITNRSYPLLFQTGETAYGRPLVDAQHPHDFFMGLGVEYARPLGENTMFQAYYAPVGDPALGPVAFPHRASAFELPQATLGHHWQDSTHIANNVATVAIMHRWMRIEASSFYGTEPNENRWNIDWGSMNSYSARFSVFPTKNWMAQVSAGHLTRPERQEEGDVNRVTASVHYTRPVGNREAWSSSFIWGLNHKTHNDSNTSTYTLETLYPFWGKNYVTGRYENSQKDELFPDEHGGHNDHAEIFRIQAFTAGYTRDLGTFANLQTGAGANVSFYAIPNSIQAVYGEHPWGVNVYLRLRLKGKM